MTSLSIPALRCGGPSNLPFSKVLRAGPLTMLLEQGELRRIRLGNIEIIRRIYTSLRGPDWATIPAELSDLSIEADDKAFQVGFTLAHRQGEFDFTWRLTLVGTPTGQVRFRAQGLAGKIFSANRISICLLQPLDECVGRPVRWAGPDGAWQEGRFPELISPDQPFFAIGSFENEIRPGVWASLGFTGETFEMEDQRNWTDGSFKIYSPPQARAKPMQVEAGWTTDQSVVLDLKGEAAHLENRSQFMPQTGIRPALWPEASMRMSMGQGRPMPAIGFGMPSHGLSESARDSERLKILAPAHLRANFLLSHPGYPGEVMRSAEASRRLGLPLEVAIFVPESDAEVWLDTFARIWKTEGGKVVRWLVFSETQAVTSPQLLAMARGILAPVAPQAAIAIGSRDDFVLLNRNQPVPTPGQELAFVMTPQVHLFDNRTMIESLQGQAGCLQTATALWPGQPLRISAITLKRTPLAMAIKTGFALRPWELWHSQVDSRQFSLFGAGWTLGVLKQLALLAPEAGLSATFYETTGLLGLMAGTTLPTEVLTVPGSDFRMDPEWVYPLYHVFADFAEFHGGLVNDLTCDVPLRFMGVRLDSPNRKALLIANLEETAGTLRLEGLGTVRGLRRLNEMNAPMAMQEPESYRQLPYEIVKPVDGILELDFLPFELIRLELV